jgi:hypothetical protein
MAGLVPAISAPHAPPEIEIPGTSVRIGALRAFGAPRLIVFAIVWLETFLIIGAA